MKGGPHNIMRSATVKAVILLIRLSKDDDTRDSYCETEKKQHLAACFYLYHLCTKYVTQGGANLAEYCQLCEDCD